MLRHASLLLLLAGAARPEWTLSQSPSTPQQIAAALLPLPEMLRAGAGVRTYSRSAGPVVLRPSMNGLMCTADRPGDAQFDVRCYNAEFLAVIDVARQLARPEAADSVLDHRLKEEARAGRLRFPDRPTAGYRMLGPISAYDSSTNSVTPAIEKWQSIHFPFRTAADLGLPTEREGTMPWVMASGTWWAHVMIVHTSREAH